MAIAFTVPGQPAPQGSHKAIFRRGMRFPIVTDDNPRTRPWRALVSLVASQHRPADLITGPVRLTARFFFSRPKSSRREHHTVRPDVDKTLRSTFDSLTGVLWVDDSQVVEVSTSKAYGDPPRAEIRVEELQTTTFPAPRRPTARKRGSVDTRQPTGRKSPRKREIERVVG